MAQLKAGTTIGGVAGGLLPAGAISPFGGTSAPSSYLLCDGAAISRTTYSALFSAIGTAFGYGNNSTTFNVPDLRGTFLRGRANGQITDPDRASRIALKTGGATGDNVGSKQTDQFRSHNHTLTGATGGGVYKVNYNAFNTAYGGAPTNYTGGNETRPTNVYVNYIIKY